MLQAHDTTEAARNAISRRIMIQHVQLLADHGPVRVLAAIDDRAASLSDLEEIGSSDISCWVKDIERSLAAGEYDHHAR